jgi:hypothetical protein
VVHIMSTAVISAAAVTSNLVAVGAIALSPRGAALGQARALAVGSSLPAVAEGVLTDLLRRVEAVAARRAATVQAAEVARRAGVTKGGMAGERAGFGPWASVVTYAWSPPRPEESPGGAAAAPHLLHASGRDEDGSSGHRLRGAQNGGLAGRRTAPTRKTSWWS